VVLAGGRLVADGPPRDVLVPEVLGPVFGIRAHLAETAEGLVFQPLATVGAGDGAAP
jgi:iron complex transport system ATP-binding protein